MTADQVPTGRVRITRLVHKSVVEQPLALQIEVRNQLVPGTWWINASNGDLKHEYIKAWLADNCPRLGSLIDTTA